MAHDANFVGNRLRLSAFLQCVEHGEMPARPSRFRRCPEMMNEPAGSSVPLHPRVHCDEPVLEAYNEPLVSASKAPTETRAIMFDVVEEAAMDEPLENHVNEKEEKTSEGSIPATTTVEKTSEKSKGLSSIPKRRLPVNELALLRTTTLDGLPIPGDAIVSFAAPIAVIDPIEESQMRFAGISSNETTRNLIITKRQPSPRKTHLLNAVRSPNTIILKSIAKPFQAPSPRPTGKLQYHLGFQNAHDGFVGSELQLTFTKRSSRRRGIISTKRQKSTPMRELALGAGPLSVSPY